MSTFATNHMFSHAHTLSAYTDRGASGFVGGSSSVRQAAAHGGGDPKRGSHRGEEGVITKTRRWRFTSGGGGG